MRSIIIIKVVKYVSNVKQIYKNVLIVSIIHIV